MMAAAPVFGHDVLAGLVWRRGTPMRLVGFFPVRISRRRYGLPLPVAIGWTHPYGPLGTPLIDRECREAVVAAWLDRLAADAGLPKFLLMPFLPVEGPAARAFAGAVAHRGGRSADFARHQRALLAPDRRPGAVSRPRDPAQEAQGVASATAPAGRQSAKSNSIVATEPAGAGCPRSTTSSRSKPAVGRAAPEPRRATTTRCAALSRPPSRRLPATARRAWHGCRSAAARWPRPSRCAAATAPGAGRSPMTKGFRARRPACSCCST